MRDGCAACGGTSVTAAYPVREMMFGLRDEFTYLECGECGSLRIDQAPEDLARYYPAGYHSLKEEPGLRDAPLIAWLKRARACHLLHGFNPVGALVARFFGVPEYYRWLRGTQTRLDAVILDVGAGTGRLLHALRREGFEALIGVEPHIPGDLEFSNGVIVVKRPLSDLVEPVDLVVFHHSLEHMPDPLDALKQAHRLLKQNRYAFVRIPIAGTFSWRTYGRNWINLDPPRHLWLPTVRGMRRLANEAGFAVSGVEFDSNEFQFWASELYARELPMSEFVKHVPPRAELDALKRRAAELNEQQDGDQACFYLQKSGP